MKNTLSDEKLRDKVTAEDKKTIEDKVQEISKWLETNQDATTEQYEAKQKELEAVANPIMQKIYAAGGAPGGFPGGPGGFPGGPGGFPGGPGGFPGAPGGGQAPKPGPNVEEVD